MDKNSTVEYDIVLPESETVAPNQGVNPNTLQKMELTLNELTTLRRALERSISRANARTREKRNARNRIAKASRKRNR